MLKIVVTGEEDAPAPRGLYTPALNDPFPLQLGLSERRWAEREAEEEKWRVAAGFKLPEHISAFNSGTHAPAQAVTDRCLRLAAEEQRQRQEVPKRALKVGDRVRLPSTAPDWMGYVEPMDLELGREGVVVLISHAGRVRVQTDRTSTNWNWRAEDLTLLSAGPDDEKEDHGGNDDGAKEHPEMSFGLRATDYAPAPPVQCLRPEVRLNWSEVAPLFGAGWYVCTNERYPWDKPDVCVEFFRFWDGRKWSCNRERGKEQPLYPGTPLRWLRRCTREEFLEVEAQQPK